jgi:hypothetical protein
MVRTWFEMKILNYDYHQKGCTDKCTYKTASVEETTIILPSGITVHINNMHTNQRKILLMKFSPYSWFKVVYKCTPHQKKNKHPSCSTKVEGTNLNGDRALQTVPQIHWNSKTVQADHGYVRRMAIFQTRQPRFSITALKEPYKKQHLLTFKLVVKKTKNFGNHNHVNRH